MQELRAGRRLADRYALARRIGAGGMSELWLARDERADATVALKFLKTEFASSEAYRDLFHKEWRIASRLMHPHIVRVFEYDDNADSPFYALQYIDGPDSGVLANVPLRDALRPIGLVADALRYAHGKSLVHRDLKASNILLDRRGVPCLIDFGIAAAASGGSSAYASPEQRAGRAPAPADDVYALGVLMHEIITGRPPVSGEPPVALSRPSGESVPDAIAELVLQMLAGDASERPAAGEVCERLEAAGFAPGPAALPAGLAGATAAPAPADVQVESIRPLRDTGRFASPAAAPGALPLPRRGVSPRTVYAGLAVLLSIFVAVIFLLPSAVVQRDGTSPAPDTVVAEPVAGDGAITEPEPSLQPQDGAAALLPPGVDGAAPGFSENLEQSGVDRAVQVKRATDEALGDLLSQLERLKYRGIERWGGQPYLDALDVYAAGDRSYLDKNYAAAGKQYRQAAGMLAPFFDRIDDEFDKALAAAEQAFGNRDFVEAIRLYDLAVAITPGNPAAERGLARARNLEGVLDLMDQGRRYRAEQELEAARLAFEKALELDGEWQPARDELAAVLAELTEFSFQMRMTEGFDALSAGDFETARAAFNAAKGIHPDSPEPRDGLLQLDQEVRLLRIGEMEREAAAQEDSEQWETAVTTYEALLEVDGDLQFAKEGLARARARAGVHRRLQGYIDEPDSLSKPATMQRATELLLDVSRMSPMGPRLADQKDELSRLLKRAATPLTVRLESDNETEVSIYRVGKLGTFATRDLNLRPGSYVAVGVRPGFRDVRREFRVAPEIDLQPIIVRCEERI